MGIDISQAPVKPGVYLFRAAGERIIYVGKAKNLRARLRSYFRNSASLDTRKSAMVREIRDFTFIVTGNELEAWILEASLIKQHRPKYNIVLRDDKNYPYVKVTVSDKWPCVEVVRRTAKDGSLYFGPYIPAQSMWEAIAFIRKNFPMRICDRELDKPSKPCIQYQMKRCHAPCAGMITPEAYMKIVSDVVQFLRGEKKGLLANLEKKMRNCSEAMKYEEAAQLRDSISSLQKAFESQKIISGELGDIDVIGFHRELENREAAISVLFVRNGIMTGSKNFVIEDQLGLSDGEVLAGFFRLFYSGNLFPPAAILIPFLPADRLALHTWLSELKGSMVKIAVPKSGKKHELLLMAAENSRVHFASRNKVFRDEDSADLSTRFGLRIPPQSVAVFDVSTLSGSDSAGAMIWWERGEFRKDMYRHAKIKWVEGMDDYAMLYETVIRALRNLDGRVPDLIIIDGGKGQLDIARRALRDSDINTDIIGVAKSPDRAFLVSGESIDLEDRNRSSLLLRKLRDEAHRFVLGFHRRLRDKRLTESVLEKIPGVGKARRLDLLRHFGSIEKIRDASVDEIAAVKGFSAAKACTILEFLKGRVTQ
jgi:excinuclease ABC subunit C